ncbi:MAG: ABC transporter ATP-binding protein [Alphaproteobacteria bacterium]
MLVVKNLSFLRDNVIIFSNFSFRLGYGDILWLQGDNGAGKTTLFKILLGQLLPSAGNILWHNKQVDDDYRAVCFYLRHNGFAYNELTVKNYLIFIKKLWGGKNNINFIAKKLQLQTSLTKKIKHLSAGMQKKLQLANIFYAADKKSIWFLDEPFTTLDKTTKKMLWQWLLMRKKQGDSIIFTSHDHDIIHHQVIKKITL